MAGLETEPVNRSTLEAQKNGYVTRSGEVGIYLSPNASRADEEMVLAHEFTHFVQAQNERSRDILGRVSGDTTEDGFLVRAIKEGAAVYATDSYMRQYVEGDALNSSWYDEIQASYPEGHVGRLANSWYIHGHEYVAARLDSPDALPTVYENPPRTTEQLLHGLDPATEPSTSLEVRASTGDGWFASGTDRMGEVFVRYALEGAVGADRARRAAAGWGNDSLHIYRSADRKAGYVWILDRDDRKNASDFESALTTALDARGDRSGDRWRLPDVNATATTVDVAPETTAFVVGPESFVAATTVAGSTETVTISVDTEQEQGA